VPGCSIKALPKRLIVKAAQHARGINPMNAPLAAPPGAGAAFAITDPMRISVLTTKYWGPRPRTLTARTKKLAFDSTSCSNGSRDKRRRATKCRAKFKDATSMSATSTSSMDGELK